MYTDFSIGSVYVRMDMPFVQCLGVSLCVYTISANHVIKLDETAAVVLNLFGVWLTCS